MALSKIRRVDWGFMVVCCMTITYAVFFSLFMIMKHRAFMTYMFDLGLYAQNLWLMLTEGVRPMHYSLVMYPLALLYRALPSPETLLVLKSIIVPLGALPLYRLTLSKLGDRAVAAGVSTLYLAYPPLHGVSQFDFHLEDFLPLLFIALTYFYEAGSPKGFLACLALCIATMEVTPLITLFSGIWLVLRSMSLHFAWPRVSISFKRDLKARLALAAVLLSIVAALAYEAVSGLTVARGYISAYYDPSAPTLSDVANYLSMVYGPLAFLPLTSLSQVAALPWLVFAFTSRSGELLQIYNQYPAFVAPFAFIGLVEALARFSPYRRLLAWVMAALALSCSVYFAGFDPVFVRPYPAHTSGWPVDAIKAERLNQIIALIPSGASVLTQNNLAPHLVNRRELYITLRDNSTLPQFILVDRSHFSFDEPNIRPSPAQLLPRLLEGGRYGLRAVYGPVELYQLGYEGNPIRLKD
jgi:uncharacterized membrane protein